VLNLYIKVCYPSKHKTIHLIIYELYALHTTFVLKKKKNCIASFKHSNFSKTN